MQSDRDFQVILRGLDSATIREDNTARIDPHSSGLLDLEPMETSVIKCWLIKRGCR